MKTMKAWAVVLHGKIEIWPDGQLGIWKRRPKQDDVSRHNEIVRVEIRTPQEGGKQ